MTTLKSRLSQLQRQAGGSATVPSGKRPDELSRLRERLAQIPPARLRTTEKVAPDRHATDALAETLNGDILAPGLIGIEETVPLSTAIGEVALHRLETVPVLPGETESPPGIYIDTETTGLAGGSGTLAFLIGIACLNQGGLHLRQYLITQFAAEAALLTELKQALPAGHRLVSYNGKTYDLPLLTTRYRMQGMRSPLSNLPHLDLLHPVRRLFAKRWADCRLTTLEHNLLGLTRQDDLPGAEAPQAWFDYMRGGRGDKLIKVVEHNRQDILSLAAGHAAVADSIRHPLPHRMDMHGLGRWLAETDETTARDTLLAHEAHLADDGRRLLAQLHRRAGCWEQAVPIWEDLAAAGCQESLERLAKYHEHVSRDLARAWDYARQLSHGHQIEHRRRRLAEKLQRQQPTMPEIDRA